MDLRGLIDYCNRMEVILKECASVLEDDLNGKPSMFKNELVEKIKSVLRDEE